MALTTRSMKAPAKQPPAKQPPTDVYGNRIVPSVGTTDDPLVPLDDPALARLAGNGEVWARKLDLEVWTDWAGRRGVAPADARRMIEAQAEATAAREAEEAAYKAYRDQKLAERHARLEKEAAERRVESERQLTRARTFAQEQAARDQAALKEAQAQEKARLNQPATFEEWKKGAGR